MAIDARYFEPQTVEEACQVLSEYGSGAKIVAGGQGIVLPLRTFRVRPQAIVNVLNVAGLNTIEPNDGSGLRIGALATLRELENAPLVQQRCPALHEAVKAVADVQIRNAATIGGHLAAAHPASDIAPVLMSLKATVTAVSTRGSRTMALDIFFTDAFKTALEADELITQIDVPPQPARTGSGYARFTIRAGDFPIIGAAATVTLDDNGVCREARLVLTSVGSNPTGEVMASAEYEKHLVGVMARYALTKTMTNVQ
jgi:carbon-monoxide dehydrogenase medium subunit